jgi:hypothetical protein
LLCNDVRCKRAMACKMAFHIDCSRKPFHYDDMVLQACNVVFYPFCTAVAQPIYQFLLNGTTFCVKQLNGQLEEVY